MTSVVDPSLLTVCPPITTWVGEISIDTPPTVVVVGWEPPPAETGKLCAPSGCASPGCDPLGCPPPDWIGLDCAPPGCVPPGCAPLPPDAVVL